jgi:molybdate-binding protein
MKRRIEEEGWATNVSKRMDGYMTKACDHKQHAEDAADEDADA